MQGNWPFTTLFIAQLIFASTSLQLLEKRRASMLHPNKQRPLSHTFTSLPTSPLNLDVRRVKCAQAPSARAAETRIPVRFNPFTARIHALKMRIALWLGDSGSENGEAGETPSIGVEVVK